MRGPVTLLPLSLLCAPGICELIVSLLLIYMYLFYVCCLLFPVNCTRPNASDNGLLGEVTLNTAQFGCKEGYSPQGTMTAVCVATDTWSPDPAQLECTAVIATTNGSGASGR